MTIACPDCGLLEELPRLERHSKAVCRLCRVDLESRIGRSTTATLACALATFILLFPANILPLLQVRIFGMHSENVIFGGVAMLWSHGWVLLSGLSAIFVVFTPFFRFGLLTAVLGAITLGYRPGWLGRVFRWTEWLDPWAMIDVYLLAAFVGYYRLTHVQQMHVSILLGGWLFMGAAFFTMLTRATIDRRSIWRAIAPEDSVTPGEETLSCIACDLVQPVSREGQPCPRCGATLHTRMTDAIPRTVALLVASFVLFFLSNLYPMNVSEEMGRHYTYTIFQGVKDLFENGLWPLGALIFCTSILIPAGKIFALGWCVLSVWRHSSRHLVAKTKTFHFITEIGRWSKTDPYTIVFFVPLMKFGTLAYSTAGWGATAFVAMTFLTMAASYTFDPRLMWDVAQRSPS